MKNNLIVVIGLALSLFCWIIGGSDPAPLPAPVIQASAAFSTPTPAPIQALGFADVQCFNCAPFAATVRVTNYDPTAGPLNCWDWDKDAGYCWSPTFIGVPWESAWGWSAACPADYPIGTWLSIPKVGNFICMDRGNEVTCQTDETGKTVCAVDLLTGGSGQWWNGQTMDITIWVPTGHYQHRWENPR